MKSKTKFSPYALKRTLQEDIQDIQPSDLTYVLHELCRMKVLHPTQEGAPSFESRKLRADRGRRSFYEPSEYFMDLKKVISKPEAKNLI